MAATITQDSADKVLANLLNIYNGEIAAIQAQWYAPFSGQPDADIGALNITYNTGTKSLYDTLDDAVNGVKADSWIALANTVESSMRAIGKYSDQASATAEVQYVEQQTAQTVEKGVQAGTQIVAKGLWSTVVAMFKGSPVLIATILIILLAVLFVIFTPGIKAAQSVAGGANK